MRWQHVFLENAEKNAPPCPKCGRKAKGHMRLLPIYRTESELTPMYWFQCSRKLLRIIPWPCVRGRGREQISAALGCWQHVAAGRRPWWK